MAKHARPKRETTDEEFASMVGRMVIAMGRRAGKSPEALAFMPALQQLVRDEYRAAGRELYESGLSLGKISEFMTEAGHKMTRQNAQQQFSPAGQSYERKRGMASALMRNAADAATVAASVVDLTVWRARTVKDVPQGAEAERKAV